MRDDDVSTPILNTSLKSNDIVRLGGCNLLYNGKVDPRSVSVLVRTMPAEPAKVLRYDHGMRDLRDHRELVTCSVIILYEYDRIQTHRGAEIWFERRYGTRAQRSRPMFRIKNAPENLTEVIRKGRFAAGKKQGAAAV